MQRLKSFTIHLSEILPQNERSHLGEAGVVRLLEEKYSHLPHPLIISISDDEATLEYPA